MRLRIPCILEFNSKYIIIKGENDLNINIIPTCILSSLFKLKEVYMFTLPARYITSTKNINIWEILLKEKMELIFKRHSYSIDVLITTFNLTSKSISSYNVVIEISNLENFLLEFLENNTAVSMIIKNFKHKYGYLIIPGKQLKIK